jgi:hypothetical protein
MEKFSTRLTPDTVHKLSRHRANRVTGMVLGFIAFLFSVTFTSTSFGGLIWQGPPTAVTYKVTMGVPTIDEGEIMSESLANGLAITGQFRIMADTDQTAVSFSLNTERPFLYQGGSYTTTASGSATFSAALSGSKGYVSIFSIYNASIYTQTGFVTPAGTASASKAPGNVSIANSPDIMLQPDTTKPWTLTPNVGYDASLNLLITVGGLTPGESVVVDFPANMTLSSVPEPPTLTLLAIGIVVLVVHGWWRETRRERRRGIVGSQIRSQIRCQEPISRTFGS